MPVTVDVSEMLALAADLDRRGTNIQRGVYPMVRDHAQQLREEWRANAAATAGTHGRLYPASITAEARVVFGAAEWEIGPETSLPQGRMGRGFEFGSVNQPPHLDGARATAAIEPRFVAAAERLMRDALG